MYGFLLTKHSVTLALVVSPVYVPLANNDPSLFAMIYRYCVTVSEAICCNRYTTLGGGGCYYRMWNAKSANATDGVCIVQLPHVRWGSGVCSRWECACSSNAAIHTVAY